MKLFVVLLAGALIAAGVYFFVVNQGDSDTEKSEEKGGTEMMQEEKEAIGKGEVEMQFSIIREGTGESAKKGDVVTVHYTGWLEDDTKFDSSVDRGTPFRFVLGAGEVIPGWDAGVAGMKVGERRLLVIPSELAYGAGGVPGAIPPNATLTFEVEMIEIKK